MVLYKDSTSYDYKKIINYIEKNYKYYAYIEHKPDSEDGKKHTHVLMHFDNKRYYITYLLCFTFLISRHNFT